MIVTSPVERNKRTCEVRGEKGLRVCVLNLCLFTCEEDFDGKPDKTGA